MINRLYNEARSANILFEEKFAAATEWDEKAAATGDFAAKLEYLKRAAELHREAIRLLRAANQLSSALNESIRQETVQVSREIQRLIT